MAAVYPVAGSAFLLASSCARWTRGVFVTAFSAVLAVGALEAVCRVDYLRKTRRIEERRQGGVFLSEKAGRGLLYRLRPNIPGMTNSAGFRDREWAASPSPRVVRIAVVGDSVAMQMSLPAEQLFPSVLESVLGQRASVPVEVLNFGVTGYGVYQEAQLFRETVVNYRPDVVVWLCHLNDAADPVLDGANGELGVYYDRPTSYALAFVRRKWTHIEQKWVLARAGLEDLSPDLRLQFFYAGRVNRVLDQVQATAREHSSALVFALYPSWPRDQSWAEYDGAGGEVYARLAGELEKRATAFVDLLPTLRVGDLDTLRFAPDDPWHPSASGHRVIAEALCDVVLPLVEAGVGGNRRDGGASEEPQLEPGGL